ncbi:ImmA/IrrE family metallo-endopeptidase [Arcanobacterium canis]|uniref:ImmA/IrrE family metallo-endopeptidase n=1 Tax=Arcanobacterium canis TaxID=999183 RepID=A0ABY8FXC0_9ACTO|nr:ImmA/IrrE family metallo-endopeptidase [Arcanobacterium canis]WFM83168.1 ImmA/IrrE family metallo-endopeptidase [Arcanobacterium canis]
MTDVHIPYLERSVIERKAMNLVNATFGKDAVFEPTIVDIHYLAEFQLNATIDYHRLSTDDTILGLSVLRDGKVNTFGPRGGKHRVQLTENTIVLDSKALADSPECRERFTVAHECGHLHLHKHCFAHTNSVLAPIQEHRVDSLDECEMPKKYASSAEWQANQFGAALLIRCQRFEWLSKTSPLAGGTRSLINQKRRTLCKHLLICLPFHGCRLQFALTL